MSEKDPVREYLQETGCGDHLIRRGLAGLVENWEGIVETVKDGYLLGLDDYLNDLDARQLLEEALAVATDEQREEYDQRIRQADRAMKSLVTSTSRCLWSDEVAEEEGWSAEANWWYYSRPVKANEDLQSEIDQTLGS